MQTYKLSKDRVQEIKNILKFKSKDKKFLIRCPQFNCIYSSGDNLVVTDNSSLAAIRTSEYEKGWFAISDNTYYGKNFDEASDKIMICRQSIDNLEGIKR